MSKTGENIASLGVSSDRMWISTDWHLHHTNILKYEHRPLGFEKLIYEDIREKVMDGDVVINLGDVIFKRHGELIQIMESLPGTHILTMGNHDRNKAAWYRSHGFHWVCKTYEYKDILFSHRPLDLSQWPNLKYNIHGHFHTKGRTQEDRTASGYPYYSENHFLVSLEDLNYKIIKLKDFMLSNGIEYTK